MGGDAGTLAGAFALALLVGLVVAAWVVGQRVQRTEDRELGAKVVADRVRRQAESAAAGHAAAVDGLDPDDLRDHGDDLADRILGGDAAD